jgi:holo-[acyl-carrier protein] synthase
LSSEPWVSSDGVGAVRCGLDLVDIGRFARILERRPGLAARLFTNGELATCQAASPGRRAECLAGRFAAKEAVLKALGAGIGSCRWHDIEVVRQPSGQPTVQLWGRGRQEADRLGVTTLSLSISHTAATVAAVVVAQGRREPGEP